MATVTNPVNWTIKTVAEEAKDYALAQAKEAGVPVGLWLEKLLLAHRDGQDMTAPARGPLLDLRQLAETMRAAADIMAVSGRQIPKRTVGYAYALLTWELRQGRQKLAAVSGTGAGAGGRSISGASGSASRPEVTPAMASSDS